MNCIALMALFDEVCTEFVVGSVAALGMSGMLFFWPFVIAI